MVVPAGFAKSDFVSPEFLRKDPFAKGPQRSRVSKAGEHGGWVFRDDQVTSRSKDGSGGEFEVNSAGKIIVREIEGIVCSG